MLPDGHPRAGGGWEHGLPSVLSAGHRTPSIERMARLQEHIQGAAEHGKLNDAEVFRRGFPAFAWHHLTD